jgi:hypothetical protein
VLRLIGPAAASFALCLLAMFALRPLSAQGCPPRYFFGPDDVIVGQLVAEWIRACFGKAARLGSGVALCAHSAFTCDRPAFRIYDRLALTLLHFPYSSALEIRCFGLYLRACGRLQKGFTS